MWDRHRLKGALKPGVFILKTYIPNSPSGHLPPDSGPTPKTIFACRHCS